MMGDDDLSFTEELVSHSHPFAQQSAGVLPQIENQTFDIPEFVERVAYLALGGLLEAGYMHVTDARTNQKVQIHAVAGNLVTDDLEFQRLIAAFAQHRDFYLRPLGSLQQIGDVARSHFVGGLAVHRDNHIARTDARAIGRGPYKGSDDDDLIVSRPYLHAYAVIFAALFFAQ